MGKEANSGQQEADAGCTEPGSQRLFLPISSDSDSEASICSKVYLLHHETHSVCDRCRSHLVANKSCKLTLGALCASLYITHFRVIWG